MIIRPLGLETRHKNFPIATYIIGGLMIAFSLWQIPKTFDAKKVFWAGNNQIAFANEARQYVYQICPETQAKAYCEQIMGLPYQIFLTQVNLQNIGTDHTAIEHLVPYIKEVIDPDKIKTKNPELFKLYKSAEIEKQNFVFDRGLLSAQHMGWRSGMQAIFSNDHFVPLVTCLFVLLCFAYPIEERMGSLFFTMTYVLSGLTGLIAHLLIFPDTFYLTGSAAAVSGIGGSLIYFYWHQNARLRLYPLVIQRKTLSVPISFYSVGLLSLLAASQSYQGFNPEYPVSLFVGLVMGFFVSFVYNLIFSLPNDFIYPYETHYMKLTQKSLSQLDAICIYLRWLSYNPKNLYAFGKMSKELVRSDLNPKVSKEIVFFKNRYFKEVYRLNKNHRQFIKDIPVLWLDGITAEHNLTTLKEWVLEFEEERAFAHAFKVNFLIMLQVGWKDEYWISELKKNYKKACINKSFQKSAEKLRAQYPSLNGVLNKKPKKLRTAS